MGGVGVEALETDCKSLKEGIKLSKLIGPNLSIISSFVYVCVCVLRGFSCGMSLLTEWLGLCGWLSSAEDEKRDG